MQSPDQGLTSLPIHHRLMRNMLLLAMVGLLFFPVYFYFFELPQYRSLLLQGAGHDSARAARHIAGMLYIREAPVSVENLSHEFTDRIDRLMRDFNLQKVKVYGPKGEIVFSTDTADVGKVNRNEYFRRIVTTGAIHSNLVTQGERSAENEVQAQDVIETYIPVMAENRFLGAFEIYYDVTARKSEFDALLRRSMLMALLLGSSVLLVSAIVLRSMGRDVAAHGATLAALAEREALLDNLTTAASDAIVMLDGQGRSVFWNRAAQHILGYTAEEVAGKVFHKLIIPKRFHSDYQDGLDSFSETGYWPIFGKNMEMKGIHKDGHEIQMEMSVAAVKHAGSWHAIAILRDIGERKRIERQLKMGSRVMKHAYEAIMITDANCIIEMVNPAFSEITGFTAADAVGHKPSLLQSGRHDEAFFAEMWREIGDKGVWQGEVWNRRKDGDIFPVLLSVSTVRSSDNTVLNYIGIFSDITRSKESEQRLEQLAFHDALTGLANRLLFIDRLRQAIHLARRNREKLAVMFLDLDGFKGVNDTYGHRTGDTLLQQVAERIQTQLREQDTVARIGGDEFTLLIQGVKHTAEAAGVAEKIRATLAQLYEVDGQSCSVGVSIGISCYPLDGDTAETLLEKADAAMYQAKQSGRNRFYFANEKGCGDD